MSSTREQFVIDASGKRTAVLLEIERYEGLIDAEEELESIRMFDLAKGTEDEVVPFAQAIEEIEETRR